MYTMSGKVRIGLFLGRFQPFHNAHKEIVIKSFEYVDFLLIGIGSSQYSLTKENPFTFKQRRIMIEKGIEDCTLINDLCRVISISDINDPPNYVQHVQKITAFNPFDVVITNNENTSGLFKEKGYDIVTIQTLSSVHGTEIRKDYYEGGNNWKKFVPPSTVIIMEREKEKILQSLKELK